MPSTRFIFFLLFLGLLSACSARQGPDGAPPPWGKVDLGLTDQERALGSFLKGEVALRQADSATAREAFTKAAQLDGSEPRIRSRLAHLHILQGNLEEALPHAHAAVALDPTNEFNRTLLAGTLAGLGREDDAADQYRELIRRSPETAEPYLLLSALYREGGRDQEAQEMLESLLRQDRDSVMGHYYLGRLHASSGRLEKSEEHFREALRKNPRSTVVLVDLGLIEEMRQRPKGAVTIYQRVLALDPHNQIARKRLADLLIGERKYEEALAHFRTLEKISSNPTETRIKIALVYLDQGNYERAATELELVRRSTPNDPKIPYYLGLTYAELGEIQRAREILATVSVTEEVFADAQLQLTYLAQREGDLAAAADHIAAAVKARPNSTSIQIFQIAIERERGNLAVALGLARQIAANYPENDHYQFTLGALLDQSGAREESISTMERAIEINPRNAEALNYLGYTFAEQGIRLEEAESLILRALAVEPQDGFYMDSLGWVYFQQEHYARAVEKLERAVELTGDDPTIQEHLGDAYRRVGREPEARQIYRTAGESARSPGQKQRIQEKLRGAESAGAFNESNLESN